MQELRQSTAVSVMLGVFVDDSDGKTTEEALTLAQADLQLSKNGATAAQKTESTSATHRYGGNYSVSLDATDTGTLGCLELMCKESGALPVKKSFMVVAQNYWDSKYSTDKLQVDVTQLDGEAQSLTDLKDFADAGYDPATNKVQGVVLTDTCTTNADMVGTNGANTTVPDAAGTAATPAEVATALTNIHLDHLFAADYDPASKPGVATALLNELIESDVGISRFTENALENAPSAGTNPNVLIDTTIAAVTDQTHFTLTAGSNDDNAYKDQAIVIYDANDSDYPSIRVCSAYTGATRTVTLDSAPDFTIANGDGCKAFVTAPGTTAPTVGQIRTEMEGAGTKLLTIEGYTDKIDDATNGLTAIKAEVEGLAGAAMRGTDSANTTTPPTVTQIRTEMDSNSTKMAPSQTLADYKATGFNIVVPDAAGTAATLHGVTDGKIDTNKTELDGLQGTDGKALISTDAQDLSATFDVNAKTATATALDLILKDSTFALAMADAIWDELLTGETHNITSSAGRRVRELGAFAIESGTAQAGTSNSITIAATANGTDGIFNRNLIVLTDNTGKGQTRTIADYNATTKVLIIDRDWRVVPDNTTVYQIVPDDTPLTVDHGIAQGATANTITIRDYASSIDNIYLCNIITILAGKGRGQARLVGSYNGTTKVVTICGDDWVEIPDTTSVYAMLPYGTTCTACLSDSALASIKTAIEVDGSKIDHLWEMTEDDVGVRRLTENALEQAPSGTGASAATVASAVWDKAQSEHVIAGTFGKIVNEINQSLNGAKCVVSRDDSTFEVYDTDGVTLMFTITKSTVGNVDTLTRS